MSTTSAVGASVEELQAVADRVVARARPGEQLEAYVGAGTSTSVDAYQGEVESLTQAGSSGIGIRVIADGRTGFAYAGSLDDDVVADLKADTIAVVIACFHPAQGIAIAVLKKNTAAKVAVKILGLLSVAIER